MAETYVLEKKTDLEELADAFRSIFNIEYKLSVAKMSTVLKNAEFAQPELFTFEEVVSPYGTEGYAVKAYTGSIREVTVPSTYNGKPVVGILSSAFYVSSDPYLITSINLPNSIEYIDLMAFDSCYALESIVIPESVHRVEGIAFYMCSLKKVVFLGVPDSIANGALCGDNIEEVYVPWRVDEVEGAPWGATAATVYYSYDVTEDAFAKVVLKELIDKSVEEISIPETVNSIGPYAFYGCTSLRHVYIPKSVTYIDKRAFAGCTLLDDIVLESGFSERYYVENNCLIDRAGTDDDGVATGVTVIHGNSCIDANIPDGVETIGAFAFFECAPYYLTIPSSVKLIEDSAFRHCVSLMSVDMSSATALEVVGGWAFSECKYLQSVTFPNSTKEILFWDKAFSYCERLTTVDLSMCNVKHIPHGMFADCSSLTQVLLPDSITRIEEAAFKGCHELLSVNIPKECRAIEFEAFEYCYKLQIVTFSTDSKLELIEEKAFYECRGLENLVLPASLSTIANQAFTCYAATGNLTTVQFSANSSLAVLGESVFMDQQKLKTINLPSTVTEIGAKAFSGCKALEAINIDNNIEVLNENVFANCISLTQITLPKKLKSIKSNVFRYCSGITEVYIPASCTNIDANAFYGDIYIQKVYVPWSRGAVANEPWGCTHATIVYNHVTAEDEEEGEGSIIYTVSALASGSDSLYGGSDYTILQGFWDIIVEYHGTNLITHSAGTGGLSTSSTDMITTINCESVDITVRVISCRHNTYDAGYRSELNIVLEAHAASTSPIDTDYLNQYHSMECRYQHPSGNEHSFILVWGK